MDRITDNPTPTAGDTPVPPWVVEFGPGPVSPEYIGICRDQILDDVVLLLNVAIASDDRAAGPGIKSYLATAKDAILDGRTAAAVMT